MGKQTSQTKNKSFHSGLAWVEETQTKNKKDSCRLLWRCLAASPTMRVDLCWFKSRCHDINAHNIKKELRISEIMARITPWKRMYGISHCIFERVSVKEEDFFFSKSRSSETPHRFGVFIEHDSILCYTHYLMQPTGRRIVFVNQSVRCCLWRKQAQQVRFAVGVLALSTACISNELSLLTVSRQKQSPCRFREQHEHMGMTLGCSYKGQ